MSENIEHDPIGHVITGYDILGTELETGGGFLGADLVLLVQPIGHFAVNVVTKGHYRDASIEAVLDALDRPDKLLQPRSHAARREPFVVNDAIMTPQVLDRHFRNRVVGADLAASLWYEGSSDDRAE